MTELSEELRWEESLRSHPGTIVILQRHGEYFGLDAEHAGWLTPAGVEQTKQNVRAKIDDLLTLGKPLDIIVINSPTALENTKGERFGRRAEQSAEVAIEGINEVLNEQLNQSEVAKSSRVYTWEKSGKTSMQSFKVQEPNYHFVYPDLKRGKDPRAYVKALSEMIPDRTERWEAYHNVVQDLEALRQTTGAESSLDIARRNLGLIKALDIFTNKAGLKNPDRLLVIWIETHNDSLRATLQHGLQVGDAAKGYAPNTSEILQLELSDGRLSTEFNGQEYSTKI